VPVARTGFPGGAAFSDVATRSGGRGDNEWNLSQLTGQLDLTMDLSRQFKLFARARGVFDFAPYEEFDPRDVDTMASGFNYRRPEYFEYDDFNDGGSQNPLEIAGRRYMLDLPSLYLDYNQGALLVRVGQQQIAWGQALFFRVLDLPNGLDLRRHLFLDYAPKEYADERVASPAVRLSYQLTADWELDSFAQKFQPTIYPNANTPYNAIASQFTIHDSYEDFDSKDRKSVV
jgi:hypothetical protein